MLLIFLLGLIAKLVLLCDGCNFGSSDVNNFNITQLTGTWYGVMHSSNPITNNLKCYVFTFGSPSLGKILFNATAYDISKQIQVTDNGYVTNWNSTGYLELNAQFGIFNGKVQLKINGCSRYLIAKICPIGLIETDVYVSYRTPQPDAATVNQAMTDLQKKGIDVTQLLNWTGC